VRGTKSVEQGTQRSRLVSEFCGEKEDWTTLGLVIVILGWGYIIGRKGRSATFTESVKKFLARGVLDQGKGKGEVF